MFNCLKKLGFADRIKKESITQMQALAEVEKHFKKETASVYSEVKQFREGKQNLEIYTQSFDKSSSMFSQMLHFLSLKENLSEDVALNEGRGFPIRASE